MAKFCTYCGKPLPEDGVCGCEASEAAKAAAEAASAAEPEAVAASVEEPIAAAAEAAPASEPEASPESAPSAVQEDAAAGNEYVKKTKAAVSQSVPFVKDYWKTPMNATLHALQEKNMALSIVLMVVNALVTGLFLFACLGKVTSSAKSAFKEMASLFGGSARVSISTPFFSALFSGILIAVIAMALSALFLFALLKILKINASFGYVVIAVGVNSVLCTACLILALVCALFGWVAPTLICLMLGVVVWAVLGVLLLTRVFGAKVSGLMLTLTSVFFAVVLALNCWLGGKLAIGAAGQIKVEDVKLKEAFEEMEDQIDDMDFEDIMDQFMKSMMYGF